MTSPNSSQSFWAEALALAPAGVTLSPSEPPGQPEPQQFMKRAGRSSTSTSPLAVKRARFASPDAEDGADRSSEADEVSPSAHPLDPTETSFLPTRLGGLAVTPHAYLQGAEYAPNAFGDIGDYMRKKEIKIQTQNSHIAAEGTSEPQIFAGLRFWINGNTSPPMEVLRKMILQRGGIVQYKLFNKGCVDYIIAPVLTLKKFKDLEKGGRLRIVREGWVVDSVKQGRLLDWTRWRLRVEGGGGAMEGFLRKSTQAEGSDDVLSSDPERDSEPDPPAQPPEIEAPNLEEEPEPADVAPPAVSLSIPSAAAGSLLRPMRASQRPPPPSMASTAIPQVPSMPAAPSSATPGSPLQKQSIKPTLETPTLHVDETVQEEKPATAIQTPPRKGPLADLEVSPKSDASESPARREGVFEKYYAHKSNREAARMMQDEDFRTNRTSMSGATFINEFYQNSRLHYLSSWKAQLKLIVAEARASSNHVPTVLPPDGAKRFIFHVDFDAFFVSAGLATRPHLKGKPVVVCHSARGGNESTSEISSASYEARAKGVRNGMSLGRARQLCDGDVTVIPYEFETYKRLSLLFYTVLGSYADELEAVSVDEALLDATGVVSARTLAPPEAGLEEQDPALLVANEIRADMRAATGCEVSIGVGSNILLAKLATRRAKPGGVFHLTADGAPDFLADLDVESLPGVGYSMRRKVEEAFGTTTCGALLPQTRESLRKALGPKTGDTLHGYLRGHDERRLEPDKERKSVSAEINYGIRFQSQDAADAYVFDLAREVAKRLAAIGARGRHMTLKVMSRHPDAPVEPPKFMGHGVCETINKSTLFPRHTDDGSIIGRECVKLLAGMRLDPGELRGLGIQVTKLEFGGQPQGQKGQQMLSFAKPEVSNKPDEVSKPPEVSKLDEVVVATTPAKAAPSPEIVAVPEEPAEEHLRAPSPPRSPDVLELEGSPDAPVAQPSSDRIDPDFLAALPPELRREVVEGHEAERTRRREASREASAPAPAPPARPERNPAAHITKQLRPKLKTQLKASEIAELPLYTAWGRDGRSRSNSAAPAAMEETESPIGGYVPSELRELGIDVDVFAALPPELQQESVAAQRERRARTVTFNRASPRKRGTTPSLPPPVANRISRPALFGARETGDVARVLAQWVSSREQPAEKDVSRVLGYLCKCVVGGLGGVEHVSSLLRGMRVLLEDVDESWGVAWGKLKEGVDAVLVERMGAGLRL